MTLHGLVLRKKEPLPVKGQHTALRHAGGLTLLNSDRVISRNAKVSNHSIRSTLVGESRGRGRIVSSTFRHEQRFDDPQKKLINGLASIRWLLLSKLADTQGRTVAAKATTWKLCCLSHPKIQPHTRNLDKVLEIIPEKSTGTNIRHE